MRPTPMSTLNRVDNVDVKLVRTVGICLLVMVLPIAPGCSRDPFDFVQASGRLTYEDGTPLPTEGGLRVIFSPTQPPINGEIYPPAGAAFPDQDGNFSSVSSSRPGGGLVRGEQKVAILYQDVDSKRFVPKAYTSPKSTPLVVHTDESPFDIKIPRP